jgi:hypothetical protein
VELCTCVGDTEEHGKAERKFQEAMENYEMASREGLVIDFSADLLLFTGSLDINFVNKTYGRSSLLWAAKRGYKAVVGLLIGRLNANVNVQDKIGQTVLQAAAEGGHLAVVERLQLFENQPSSVEHDLIAPEQVIQEQLIMAHGMLKRCICCMLQMC